MRRLRARPLAGLLILIALAVAAIAVALAPAQRTPAPPSGFPPGFFGMGLAVAPSAEEFELMRDGGVDSARYQLYWPTIEPEEDQLDWSSYDAVVADAAASGINILPVVNGTPEWLADDPTVLPVQDERQRSAWEEFLEAAATRYGPGGNFWRSRPGIPETPPVAWQIWNEPNFFYFAADVSPSAYARLVEAARAGLDRAADDNRLILAGLFARPPRPGPDAVPAADFLSDLYEEVDTNAFDGVALHPYSAEAEEIGPAIEEVRAVMEENGDAESDLWITEIGWGSAFDTGFEKGPLGQVGELTTAYTLMERNWRDWRVPAMYWFAWQDTGGCDFCDSTGLTRRDGSTKLAWQAFKDFAAR